MGPRRLQPAGGEPPESAAHAWPASAVRCRGGRMSMEPRGDDPTPGGELLLYATNDGRTRVECRFDGDTLWLSQAAMMELSQSTRANISIHLRHIFDEGELAEE